MMLYITNRKVKSIRNFWTEWRCVECVAYKNRYYTFIEYTYEFICCYDHKQVNKYSHKCEETTELCRKSQIQSGSVTFWAV